MSDRDVLGPWFDAISSLGEDANIHFGRIDEQGAAPRWFHLPHSNFDGVGGFAELLRENGHSQLGALPELKESRSPRIPQLLQAWVRYVFRLRLTYSFVPLSAPGKTFKVASRVFDEKETAQIAARAKSLAVSVNTFLLDRITNVVRQHLEGRPRDVAWMIPINMRGPVVLERDTANHSSFLEIAVQEGELETALQARVRGAVERGEHWSFYYLFMLGRLFGHVGRKLFMRLTIRGRSHWVGSFSNLGRWDPPEDGSTPYAWVFFPPTVPSQPIGVGCVTYRGRLGIAFQIHSSLAAASDVAGGWISEIASSLLA